MMQEVETDTSFRRQAAMMQDAFTSQVRELEHRIAVTDQESKRQFEAVSQAIQAFAEVLQVSGPTRPM